MMRMSQHSHNPQRTRTRRRRDWLGFPPDAQRMGTALLNQQCWLWGQDIRRPEGNALLEYGFSRQRPPDDQRGSNAYIYALEPCRTVILWSFGMFYGNLEQGGIYLGRYSFAPAVLPPIMGSLPWLPCQLPMPTIPRQPAAQCRPRKLLSQALHWLGDYEAWVQATLGLEYRQHCVAAWKLGPFQVPAERIVLEWRHLALHSAVPPSSRERRESPLVRVTWKRTR